ncbi:MAG: Lrp/AsnC family transcriptional regulator [Saprospiraceae bacterium]|nr:Lrp/AsnC family transcriptional regulator [Saprospiraceae bacterium]
MFFMIDHIDKKILSLLTQNSKLTIREISREAHLSPTPVYERIKKMENENIIQGYTIVVNNSKLDLNLVVFCHINLEIHHKDVIEQFEKDILHFEEVIACYHLAGVTDYLLHVIVKDMVAYQEFLKNKLASVKNIRNVQSAFVMEELKKRR